MKLRAKVLVILASMWVVISILIYLDARMTLEKDYKHLEIQQVVADITRTQKTFTNQMVASLKILNTDWSQWDDAYQFVKNKNNNFIKANLAFTTFENAKINFILFFDENNKLAYGQYYDLIKKKFFPLPTDLLSYLTQTFFSKKNKDAEINESGIIKLPSGYVLLNALPILNSEGEGPVHGTLLMGYYLTASHIQQLSQSVGMPMEFFPLPLTQKNKITVSASDELKKGVKYSVIPKDSRLIYGFFPVNNIENQPIGMIRIDMPRTLYIEGILTLQHYFLVVIGIGIIVLLSMWYLLKLFVLDRIISVSRQVVEIKSESQFNKRIQINGNDELYELVLALNSLLEIIDISQDQLKYRISQHSEKLERLSELNKNLFSEVSRQKVVEEKLLRGEKLLRQMAYFDAITGLPNRVLLSDFLREKIIKAEKENKTFALLFLDTDQFKDVNDTYGHDVGDKFLQHIAMQIKVVLGKHDMAARISGDEFIIYLDDAADKSTINYFVKQLFESFNKPMKLEEIELKKTCSIGISIYPKDGLTISDLEKHADIAMYYAKRQRGNAFCYYDAINEIDRRMIS